MSFNFSKKKGRGNKSVGRPQGTETTGFSYLGDE